jgi:two-component system NarL family sensor kinase
MSIEISEVVVIVAAGTSLLFLLIIFLLTLFFIFQRRQLATQQEKVALHAQYAREILQTQLEVQNNTLQQIAGELHDNIGQLLFVAKINLDIFADSLQPGEDREKIVEANEIVGQSITELRSLVKSFDSDFVKDFGLYESISNVIVRIRKTKKCQVEMNLIGKPYSLGYDKEIVLFRIGQEVLNNTLKHAHATNILVRIEYRSEKFIFCIKDDGCGFDFQPVAGGNILLSGSGLRNMQRRTSLIRATFSLKTAIGRGTEIEITLPNPVEK